MQAQLISTENLTLVLEHQKIVNCTIIYANIITHTCILYIGGPYGFAQETWLREKKFKVDPLTKKAQNFTINTSENKDLMENQSEK